MLIQKKLCPPEKYPIKATYPMTPVGICIHNTANSATAQGEVNYMLGNAKWTSYHYAVDEMGAVQALPLDRNGWHAGDGPDGIGNRYCIGIEICRSYVVPPKNATPAQEAECEARWRKEFKPLFERAQENAAELTATLLHDMGWGKDLSRVKKHQDFDGKYCPHRTMSDYGWDYFLDLVRKKYEELYEEEPMTAAEKEAFKKHEDKVAKLEAKVKTHNDQIGIKWAYVDKNLPEWARPTAEKLVKKKILQGTKNSYEMSYLLLRILVMLDRAGMFD
ncbi:MAG: N-acetylmuramoyl-L-alanine amidase [Clostridiales bacterium]|nr:N-acetylmuramoyl-L-alanine amidase [Clostridiales bacterium]